MILVEEWATRSLREPALMERVREEVAGSGFILEVGCGNGQRLLQVAAADDEVMGIELCPPPEAPPFVVVGDARAFDWSTTPRPPGAVLFIDSLEHFERADGEALLDQACRRARQAVVVFCPYGDQGPVVTDRFGPGRRSAWYPEDFVARGFRTVTVLRDYHMPGADGSPSDFRADAILACFRPDEHPVRRRA